MLTPATLRPQRDERGTNDGNEAKEMQLAFTDVRSTLTCVVGKSRVCAESVQVLVGHGGKCEHHPAREGAPRVHGL